MKLKILNLNKSEIGTIDLPKQFYEPVRKDIIRKAFTVIQSNKRQPYGAKPDAGKRASAEVSRRRRKYRGSYGIGISRVPRKVLSRRGTRMNWVGAFAPGTVGGRRAHPPKVDKIWALDINKKERKKAIRSAMAATLNQELVLGRGHLPPQNYPFIIDEKIEDYKQTKELLNTLSKLGFQEELDRSRQRNSKGLLIVTAKNELKKSCSNIPGFDIEELSNLNVELLAPGGHPGRMTLFTRAAIIELTKTNLFTDEFKEEKAEKKVVELKSVDEKVKKTVAKKAVSKKTVTKKIAKATKAKPKAKSETKTIKKVKK